MIQNLVDDHIAMEVEGIRGPRGETGGKPPLTRAVWPAATRFWPSHDGIQDTTLPWRKQEKSVAGGGAKPKGGVGDLEELTWGERGG